MYRSMLYVPAHSERFLAKAHERGADAIILDLEDSVPEVDKEGARALLPASVRRAGQAGAAILVRINSGPRAVDDAKAAVAAGTTAIVVAKADPLVLAALAFLGVPLVGLLEDPAAILDARLCATLPGVMGLMVGGEDLALALGATPDPEVLRTPKLLVHYAAKAEGKFSFGMLRSIADYSDIEALKTAAIEAHAHGFDGSSCVHPAVVPILNAAFTPSADEIAWANSIVEVASTTSGAFALNGRMVDRPVVDRAQAILRQAR
ncbi:MAG: CoA ester lyase [Devosia sp.]